ncbi:hypothetical protein CHL76_05380 [Marinococcus halophilus]|uniref:Uncharacterized protein n=1 Tax=Marinococcus halophilus TaxID=1371 RepID=A0A510Y4U7_MARHA|nr:hypothetical protein [Marinococcus halophilus]OZT80760.1 hypothetical protein CHL76_05380 [Marinococcus halophilus]GEK57811.1 hypothetical protein MHA01_07160 [Marinococcus halophilus]
MEVQENQLTFVQEKAKELSNAMELRGWASTKLVPTPPYGYTLVSMTGCRAWFGKRWGMINDDRENFLKVVLDIPKGRTSIEEVSERLDLDIVHGNEGKTGVEMIDNRDRHTIVIYLFKEMLEQTAFRESETLELISDVRRWSCL